jgi:integrase/recombinase XerD
MTLVELVTSYLTVKRAAGMRFDSEASLLQAFCRAMGDIEIAEVTPHKVHAFLAGHRPITTYWHHKYTVLGGLYRFALSRGYLVTSPLPRSSPSARLR